MKAEINENGLLLEAEGENDVAFLAKWVKDNKGIMSVPKKRSEYATIKFNDISVIICGKV